MDNFLLYQFAVCLVLQHVAGKSSAWSSEEQLCSPECSGRRFLHLVHGDHCKSGWRQPDSDDADILHDLSGDSNGCENSGQRNWSSVRNKLFADALDLPCVNCYLYIVLIDSSFGLEVVGSPDTAGDPWQTFHSLLLWWEPAVGQPDSALSDVPHVEEVVTPFRLDHSILAIHREATSFLLPYYDRGLVSLEEDTLHLLSMMALSAYRNHVLQFNELRISSRGPFAQSAAAPPSIATTRFAAESMRRLGDFLSLERVRDVCDVDGMAHGFPQRRSRPHQYVICGHGGIFDPCHPLVSRRCDEAAAKGWMFCPCVSSASTGCAPSPLRLQEKLLLWLQEVFTASQELEAERGGGKPRRECNPYAGPVHVQISHPELSTVLAGEDRVRVRGLVAGLPKLHGAVHDGFAVRLTANHAVISTIELPDHYLATLGSLPEWYCAPESVVNARGFWWDVELPPRRQLMLHVEVLQGAKAGSDSHTACVNVSKGLFKHSRLYCPPAEPDLSALRPITTPGSRTTASTIIRILGTGEKEEEEEEEEEAEKAQEEEEEGGEGASTCEESGLVFAYLVQSDECLDLRHLMSPRSVVIQLTWKAPPGPECPHRDVLFFPGSTLVQGRNRLFREVQWLYPSALFLYLIMMDGDVKLVEAADFGSNTGSPWRTWERYLLQWEPAVGVPHFSALDYNPEEEVQLVYNFDQIVVAYHREAVPLLLPYTERFDAVSWWYCGAVQNALLAAVYNEHRLQFNALRAISWNSNLGSSYLRASNFHHPLAWIAPAITSLDALMTIPLHTPILHSTANTWDPGAQQWTSTGRPRRKSSSYLLEGRGDAVLDWCHPYFENRALSALCRDARRREELWSEGGQVRALLVLARQLGERVRRQREALEQAGDEARLERATALLVAVEQIPCAVEAVMEPSSNLP